MNAFQQELDDFRRTPDGKIIQGAAHTSRVLNHKYRNSVIIKAICSLRKIEQDFDSIACCGVSGLMVVPQICEILNKNIIIVRKFEKRYSEFYVEGVSPSRYVIVDDLICSGDTLKHIIGSISDDTPRAKCIGAYFYLGEECSFNASTDSKLFEKHFGTIILNPYQPKT
jgi:adenine/guanine phosphoribosyltransferase-like PRPP-binding protein